MTITGAPSRAFITVAASAAAVFAVASASPAWAHVHVDADDAAPGATSVLTFRVPGESENGSTTTKLSIKLPDVTSARTELMPGWTAQLDRNTSAGTVSNVTWTAVPGTGISSDQFALFRISVTLPHSEHVSFPATQTYSDGSVVRWDQPPQPGGGEPEFPAPELTMTGSGPADDKTPPAAATAAADPSRWLAGGALVVAAAALVTAFAARRRS